MEPNDVVKARLMDERDLSLTLDRMARQIVEHLEPGADDDFAVIGMQTRGVHLARRLRDRVARFESVSMPLGVLDATMYRDDFRMRRGEQPVVRVTDIPFDVAGKHLFLVDDVLFTGRTIRAGLEALMDMGRPASVLCLVLVDRGHHELPIHADIVGRVVPTVPGEEVRVRLSEIDEQEGVWLVRQRSEETGGE